MENLLLIEPKTESLSSRILFIKPKELIQGEHFRLRLQITNKGDAHFPGGKLTGIKLVHQKENIRDDIESQTIPALARDESTLLEIWHPYAVGMMAIECRAEAEEGTVRCYQKLPATGKLELLKAVGDWVDFISVSSKADIYQRHTNLILIVLTFFTVTYYITSLFFNFPLFGSENSIVDSLPSPSIQP